MTWRRRLGLLKSNKQRKDFFKLKLKHIIASLAVVGSLAGTLAVSSTEAHASFSSVDYGTSQISYQKARKRWKHVHKLAYFENESSDSDDRVYYGMGWYYKGRLRTCTLDSDGDAWQEIVDPNLTTPYVVFEKPGMGTSNVVIHRPPYNLYNQPQVSGKVTEKE